jgi:hypothetical protein
VTKVIVLLWMRILVVAAVMVVVVLVAVMHHTRIYVGVLYGACLRELMILSAFLSENVALSL